MSLKYEKIEQMWAEDKELDTADLTGELVNIPILYDKYYVLCIKETLILKKLKNDLISLEKDKKSYFLGEMDEYDLIEKGWPPQPLKILRQDILEHIKADPDVQTLVLKVALQEEAVKYLENITKRIIDRGYHIKTILEFEKFKTGAY